jgi:hypothetical protein
MLNCLKRKIIVRTHTPQHKEYSMSLCPKCGRYLCDHTEEERGQTYEEMMRPLSPEEEMARQNEPADSPIKIKLAIQHAHDPV